MEVTMPIAATNDDDVLADVWRSIAAGEREQQVLQAHIAARQQQLTVDRTQVSRAGARYDKARDRREALQQVWASAPTPAQQELIAWAERLEARFHYLNAVAADRVREGESILHGLEQKLAEVDKIVLK